ncbi:MAG TPA: hypothetical protein VF170_01870 [Planctomycetaceae bacterium]
MRTLFAWAALLVPLAVTAEEPLAKPALPRDGRFVVELALEVRSDDAEGKLRTTLVSQDARRLATGEDGFAVAFGPEELRGEVTVEAVTDAPPRQFRVAVRLRHKEQVAGAATLTVLDRQVGQVGVVVQPGGEDKLSVSLTATVGDSQQPVEEKKQGRTDRPESEAEQRIEAALASRASLGFEKKPLREALEAIRDEAGVDIVIDKAALSEEGLTPETPVSIRAHDLRLDQFLTHLLEPLNLTYVVDREVLKVTSKRRAKGPLVVQTYPVADLIVPLPRLVTAHAEADPATPAGDKVRTAAVVEPAVPLTPAFDDLVNLITGTVDPGSWEQVGGWGVIRTNETTRSLVVRQTHGVHEEIADLLQTLRRRQREAVKLEMTLFRVPAEVAKRFGDARRLGPDERDAVVDELSAAQEVAPERFPTATLFHGQAGQFTAAIARKGGDERSGHEHFWLAVRPEVLADAVRLTAAPGTEILGRPPVIVPDGHAALIDVTPPDAGPGSAIVVGRPVTGKPRVFKAERTKDERLLLLVTPRIIPDEETPAATPSGAIEAPKRPVYKVGGRTFMLDVF